MPSPVDTVNYLAAYNQNLLSLERNIFLDPEREWIDLARQDTTQKLTNEMQGIQGLAFPSQVQDLNPLPQVSPVTGYKSVIRTANYRSQVTVEKTAIETMYFRAPLDNARDMMRSVNSLKDKVVADIYNNGYTDGLTQNIVELDGTARRFFSTVHQYENGAGTWSNLYAVGVPPTPEVVWLIINSYFKRLQDYAKVSFVPWGMEFLIITPTLTPSFGMAADEIVKSQDKPNTADRATNVLTSFKLRHRSLNWLTSSTKWYILAPPNGQKFPVSMLERIPYEVDPLAPAGPVNPRAYYTSCTTSFGVGFVRDYRGAVSIGS